MSGVSILKSMWSFSHPYGAWARASVRESALCALDTSMDYEFTKNGLNIV